MSPFYAWLAQNKVQIWGIRAADIEVGGRGLEAVTDIEAGKTTGKSAVMQAISMHNLVQYGSGTHGRALL